MLVSYKEISEIYRKISDDARGKIVALTLTTVGAIYVLADKKVAELHKFKWALLLFIITLFFDIIAAISKSQHYALYIDGKIEDIDYRKSYWGRIAEILFWIPLGTFITGLIIMIIAIIKL